MSCLSPPLSPWLVGPLTSYLCRLAKIISAWWLTYPSEKYESQLILLFPICGEKACSKPPTRYSNLCKSMKTHTTKTMQYLSLSLPLSLSPSPSGRACQVPYFKPRIVWHKPLSCILKQLQRYVPTDTLATRLRKGCLAGYCNHTLREAVFFSVLYLSMISCITLLPRDTRRVKTIVIY